jgi:putative tricarboxylic transport membrane protein
VTLRADHIAGGAFVILGVLVFALSGELPFGTLSFPGSGFFPKLLAALLIVFGALLALRASESAPISGLDWGGFWHALLIVTATAMAALLYTRAGFLLTIFLLLVTVLIIIERKHVVPAVIFSASVTALAYSLFVFLLKSPLPRGPWGF